MSHKFDKPFYQIAWRGLGKIPPQAPFLPADNHKEALANIRVAIGVARRDGNPIGDQTKERLNWLNNNCPDGYLFEESWTPLSGVLVKFHPQEPDINYAGIVVDWNLTIQDKDTAMLYKLTWSGK